METIKPHVHNDSDSPKLYLGDSAVNAPQETVTVIAGTADSTYSSNEQTMINDLKTAVNDLIDKLQNVGILK